MMQVENSLGWPLSAEEMLVQTCVDPHDMGHQQPKNYRPYLTFVTVYMSVFIVLFLIFFKTEMKRTLADTTMATEGAGQLNETPSTVKVLIGEDEDTSKVSGEIITKSS